MQKLKMKFVLLSGIFLFSSCGSLPKKPLIEICAHNENVSEVECFDNQTQTNRTLRIDETDRYIMFSPDDWGLILLYLRKLEKRIRNKKVKFEMKKVFKANNKLQKSMRTK